MHDVDVEAAGQRGEPGHGHRPVGDVASPRAHVMAGRQPGHRDDVQGRAGGLELGRERRRTRHGDVEVELAPWEAPHEPEERLVRPTALGDRLHGEDRDRAGCRQRRTAAPRGAGWHRSLHGGVAEATPGPAASTSPRSPPVTRVPTSNARLHAHGLDGLDPVILPLPAAVLYDAWHVLGVAGPGPARRAGRPRCTRRRPRCPPPAACRSW